MEDAVYRSTTQYRYWSYTPQVLATLRASTNEIAAERVKAAIVRVRAAKENQDGGDGSADGSRGAIWANGAAVQVVDCLTVEEEQKLVAYYCRSAIDLGTHLNVPTDVKVSDLASPEVGDELHAFITSNHVEMKLTNLSPGNGCTIHQTLLPHQ